MNYENLVSSSIAGVLVKINKAIKKSLLPISVSRIDTTLKPYIVMVFYVENLSDYSMSELRHFKQSLDVLFDNSGYDFTLESEYITVNDCIPF